MEKVKTIINPFKKYCKKELAESGYKLAFLDTSVLIGSNNNPLQPRLNKEIVSNLKRYKIRPVVNDFTLSEFIKGLDEKHPKYQEHHNNKIATMECLDDLECLFLLPHQGIESMELQHILNHLNTLNENAHNVLKVFGYSPVNTNYKGLAYYTYKEYLTQLIKLMGRAIQQELNNGLRENVECADLLRGVFKDFCDKDKTLLRKELCRNFVSVRLSNYDDPSIIKLVDILNDCIDQFLSFAPFYSTSNYLWWKQITDQKEQNTKDKQNNFMDSMHFISAISYCDFFISYDSKLVDSEIYKKTIENFVNHKVEICKDFSQWGNQ